MNKAIAWTLGRTITGLVAVLVLAVALSVPLPFASPGRAGAAAQPFRANGDGAWLSAFDPITNTGMDVYVNQGNWQGQSATWMGYDLWTCSEYGCIASEAGYGPIPNSDLTGNAREGLHLSTNTSPAVNPNFVLWAGSGGSITVDWKKNDVVTQTSSGTSRLRLGSLDYMDFTSGSWTQSSATAQGSVIGTSVPAMSWSTMGTFRSVNISVTHS